MKKANSGFGFETLEQRLSILYKKNFRLERHSEDDIFISHLKITLLEDKAQMPAVG